MKTLQEIVDDMNNQISDSSRRGEPRDSVSWGPQGYGVCISRDDASIIAEELSAVLMNSVTKALSSTPIADDTKEEWHLPDDDLPLTRKHFRLVLNSIDNLGLRIEALESKVAPSKDYDAAFNESLHLLRELADIQNGPPLEHQRQKWQALVETIYSFLRKWEGESTGL